jgi:hypothetical protein
MERADKWLFTRKSKLDKFSLQKMMNNLSNKNDVLWRTIKNGVFDYDILKINQGPDFRS